MISKLIHWIFLTSHHHLPTQSSDSTVFFFTVGEKYNPIGFVQVPGPVQALEWSPHSHVSLVADPLLLKCLWWSILNSTDSFFILPRVKTGCLSCVRMVTWSRFRVLTRRPRGRPKPSSCLNRPADISGSGASNLKLRSELDLPSL